ncbi:WGxxGxxG-CTERM domain-containing protein [Phormidium sp. LEGE 05292]|uniref:WGxxGxxG family protein n=1 Tax=[Phormidium] sp. LEGE 05292 TaxID=767427 RepID=UPI001881CA2B|nr:WGxxGxxG family protein [Phormidium sp. LEGE 05292]MBE9229352.1 WGxxGxxG-CTERM domain-containing protein [Phormidium sp. LEGE 05292]
MKTGKLSKFLGASLVTLSLASLPLALPVSAQTGTPGTTGDTTTGTNTTSRTADYNTDNRDSFDWGWLGLLGLIGLAGLAGRNKHEEPVRYREPDEASRPGTRY